jgi:four helix bundle protein
MIRDFTDLKVWQEGRKFRLQVYTITKTFPAEERYGLTSQMRRAASSFTANIAEGFGRQSSKDQERFYVQAHGSMFECRDHLTLALDMRYIDEECFKNLYEAANRLHRLMNGLLRSHQARRTSDVGNRASQ